MDFDLWFPMGNLARKIRSSNFNNNFLFVEIRADCKMSHAQPKADEVNRAHCLDDVRLRVHQSIIT